MKVIRFVSTEGKEELAAISRDDWKLLKKDQLPDVISAFHVKVLVKDNELEEDPKTYHRLPMVVLDQDSAVEVTKNSIKVVVCVLNVELFHNSEVVYYYGIPDVFFIAKKKLRNAFVPIKEDEFPLRDKNSLKVDREVRLYLRKVDIVASIHRAIQACHKRSTVLTDHITLSAEDFVRLTNELKCEYEITRRSESMYTVLPMGHAEKSSFQKDVAVAKILTVSSFEECFGFLSTFKYDVNINALNNLVAMNTTNGLFISRTGQDEENFESLELIFDMACGNCRVGFTISPRLSGQVGSYFMKKYNDWQQQFKAKWEKKEIESLSQKRKREAEVRQRNVYQKYRAPTSARRASTTMNKDVTIAILQKLIEEEDLDEATRTMHKDLRYVVCNLPKRQCETVSMAFQDLMVHHPAADIDSIISGLHISLTEEYMERIRSAANESAVKGIKIECVAIILDNCYNEEKTRSSITNA